MSKEWPSNKKIELHELPNEKLEEHKKYFEKQKISIALELIENNFSFPFPGITRSAIDSINTFHEEFPEIGPTIEEVLSKFEDNEIKLTMGNSNRNVVAIPIKSNNAIHDSIPLKDLQTNKQTPPKLKLLIEIDSILTTIGNLRKIRKNKK